MQPKSNDISSYKKTRRPKIDLRVPWDASFKAFFSYRVMIASLITSFLPPEIVDFLDLSTLEQCPNNYLTKAIRQRFNDCIWRTKMGNSWFYCYFMLEFQRKTDKLMALRIAEYNSLLLRSLYKAKLITMEGDCPPIIPIVIFMGEGNWTAKLSIHESRPGFSQAMDRYQLQQEYILLHANRKTAGSQRTLAELLFAICDSRPGHVESLVKNLETLLVEEELENLRQLFLEMINYAILIPAGIDAVDPTINFQEAGEMMAAKAQKWREEVLNEGILIGEKNMISKAQKWREEVLNEGILQGIGMPEAKAQKWHQDVENKVRILERSNIAYEMLKAGKPRAEIIQFTKLTDAELDKLQ